MISKWTFFPGLIFLALWLPAAATRPAAQNAVNQEESKVKPYTLPDLLTGGNGKKALTVQDWEKWRRPEILRMLESEMYGRTPKKRIEIRRQVIEEDTKALGGKATRKQLALFLGEKLNGPRLDVLIYLPNQAARPVPAFLGLNFNGNQAVHSDPAILISRSWQRENRDNGIIDHRATESSRGVDASRWMVEKVLARGYAVVTACYNDMDPDFDDGFQNGIQPLFYRPGQKTPAADEWGAIGAWAWGLSRILDVLEKEKAIDARRVAVHGHSRLGKAALWAGAQDRRFALVISNDSGCGGAALSKRNFGETVGRINTSFPHWFCTSFRKYNDREEALPFDQHMLLALIAPRPLYVASAEEDLWADPLGEFLGAKNAEPAYALFSKAGLGTDRMPPVHQPVGDFIGYHIRAGKHNITEYDWEQYLKFADRHFQSK